MRHPPASRALNGSVWVAKELADLEEAGGAHLGGHLEHAVDDVLVHALENWAVAAGFARGTLELYEDTLAFVAGDASRYEAIRSNEFVEAHAAGDSVPIIRDELAELASRTVAHLVTAALGDVRVRVAADVEGEGGGEPGVFLYFFEPEDLLGHAFAELAHLMVQHAPLRKCPECGRFFAVEHGRQQFCTPTCAGRARQRRFAERHKREESRK